MSESPWSSFEQRSEPRAGISGFLSRDGTVLRDVAILIYFLYNVYVGKCAADRRYKPPGCTTVHQNLPSSTLQTGFPQVYAYAKLRHNTVFQSRYYVSSP